MGRNQIQLERMRGFFIDAAVAILKSEGPAGISARNVAARAGYSYATLYNYFKDVNDLVFECLEVFCRELNFFVREECQNHDDSSEKIKATCRAYAKYFLQNPGIFELFFIEKASDLSNPSLNLASATLAKLIQEDLSNLVELGQIEPQKSEQIGHQLLFSITGMLLLFLNRSFPNSFSEFVAQLDESLEQIFS